MAAKQRSGKQRPLKELDNLWKKWGFIAMKHKTTVKAHFRECKIIVMEVRNLQSSLIYTT